jgi:hypothetical protein
MPLIRLFLLVPLMLALAGPALAGRHALVIGNSAYDALEDLRNPGYDAAAYHAALLGMGYRSTLYTDLGLDGTLQALDAFMDTLSTGDEVVFVFSGHGWSDGAVNYLLPTDAPASGSDRVLERASLALRNGHDGVLDELEQLGVSLSVAIIDACRNNPFEPRAGTKSASISRGLAPVSAPVGSFVIFSAGAGQEALDYLPSDRPEDTLSVFTRTFLPRLTAGLYLETAISDAQIETYDLARSVEGHLQQPAYYDETLGKTCLTDRCSDSVTLDRPKDEVAFLAAVRTATPEALDAFIAAHPDSSFLDAARAQLAILRPGGGGTGPAPGADIPVLDAAITLTGYNTPDFETFVTAHVGQIAFLRLHFDRAHAMQVHDDIEMLCNADFNDWDSPMAGQQFALPYGPEGLRPGDDAWYDLDPARVTCSDQRFAFSGIEPDLSSAGPGTHWYQIEGFFKIRDGAGRWPFLELIPVEMSGETWLAVERRLE